MELKFFQTILSTPLLHAKWLNTLSYLENCGAKMIADCQHPTLVKEEMLKHAAEEFRHAHYLKSQIQRISSPLEDYSLKNLLGGFATLHYLKALNLKACLYLKKKMNLPKASVKELAYLLVTYAIERRAEKLYPLYESYLRFSKSKVKVKSILLEEKEHLAEMIEGIKKINSGMIYAEEICYYESIIFNKWFNLINKEVIITIIK